MNERRQGEMEKEGRGRDRRKEGGRGKRPIISRLKVSTLNCQL